MPAFCDERARLSMPKASIVNPSRAARPWGLQAAAKVETAGPVTTLEPTRITVQHWGRLQDGELLAKSRTIDGVTLMERTWALDAKKYARCGGVCGCSQRSPIPR